jgi:hypothetical protein
VPTGCVWLPAALLGSTITAVAWPSWKSRSGLGFFSFSTTAWLLMALKLSMLAKVARSLLGLPGSAARSRLNFTAAASKGSPLWNFTPRRSVKLQVLRSGVTAQSAASSGTVLPSLCTFISVSKTL